MYQCDGDPERTLELAVETVALARENSMPYWIAWGSVLEGWALVRLGRVDMGLKALDYGLRAYREGGAELFRRVLAQSARRSLPRDGRPADARVHLQEALASAQAQGVDFYTAEIHRLRADLALELDDDTALARSLYLEATALAKTQGALAFETRAAVPLAELLFRMGAGAEAARVAHDVAQRLPAQFTTPEAQRLRELAARTTVA